MQASDQAGLFYGVSSLMQLLRICEEDGIPPLQIHDWPALRDRGLLLDMSKGRIPTLVSRSSAYNTRTLYQWLNSYHAELF